MAESNIRLVHLDLKGAPPALSYLRDVIPMMRRWGATGLLVEYEDMFPYYDDLVDIASPRAYTEREVKNLIQLADENGMEIMPLVQTFGHLEFVLKQETFAKIREIPHYPTALCPSHPDSVATVTAMIDQVLTLHPRSRWFHIGCDEVYHLGKCNRCLRQMADENLTTQQLFFNHVKVVAHHVKTRYPHVTPVVWDDMFRFAELKELERSGLKGLVEPMVWHYLSSFSLPENLFDNLAKVFPNVWVASAFKGATGVCSNLTNISFHIENHMAWVQLIEQKKSKFNIVRGFAITGWQRYDHYAVLCELLPASLPSLALCLGVAKHGKFTQEMHQIVSMELGFVPELPLNPFQCCLATECSYPGAPVYCVMSDWVHLQAKCDQFLQSEMVFSWMNDYNVYRGFVNPMHVDPIVAQATNILSKLCDLQTSVQRAMAPIYGQDTITEWVQVYLQPKIQKFSDVVRKGERILGKKAVTVKPIEILDDSMSQDA